MLLLYPISLPDPTSSLQFCVSPGYKSVHGVMITHNTPLVPCTQFIITRSAKHVEYFSFYKYSEVFVYHSNKGVKNSSTSARCMKSWLNVVVFLSHKVTVGWTSF